MGGEERERERERRERKRREKKRRSLFNPGLYTEYRAKFSRKTANDGIFLTE